MPGPSTYGQWSLNGGELSPRMQARVDQAIYANAVAAMVGYLPLLQGPAVAAPGTRFVEMAAAEPRLIPFEFNPTQGYVIEATAGKFRFYTNDARIETAPGVAYEVAHPWTLDELRQLDYWQSEDVLYLVGANKQAKKLTRTGATTFTLTDLVLTGGPMEIGNSDESITVKITNTTGATQITSTGGAIFAPTDIGRLFEIECEDFNDVRSWEPGIDVDNGTKLQWGGRVYQVISIPERTGTVPPEHDSGAEWDGTGDGHDVNDAGPYGAKLKYLYNRYGLARITGYISPTKVGAAVIKRMADSLNDTGSYRWTFGAFSDTSGWPDTVGGWNGCMVLTRRNRAWPSVIDDLENFSRRDSAGDFQRDLSGGITLPNAETIKWQASDRFLLLGTDKNEYTIERVQVQTGVPGPPVFNIQQQSSNGSAKIKPIQADGRMLFAQRSQRKLREMGYAIANDRYIAPDMTRLADHIGMPGFVELAWQAEPERLAWGVRGDGSLAAMTYDPQQEVMGWSRRFLGGNLTAVSACRITDPEGKRDQIWIAADNGDGQYLVLRQEKIWEQGDAQEDAFFVDAGLTYSGPPATIMSGLDHLEGEAVDILADGKPHPQRIVTGGEVSLNYSASLVHIGLPFQAWIETLPPETGQSEGVSRGKTKRISALDLHVLEAQGIRVSVQGCEAIEIDTRRADDPADEAVPLYSGILSIPTIGTYDQLGQIRIERFQPTPSTILAIVPKIEVGE